MDEKAKRSRAAYYRAWRRKNPEKVRAINERYWIKKAKLAEEAELEERSVKE